MKRRISGICCLLVAACLVIGTCVTFLRYCNVAAESSCAGAQTQIKNKLEATLTLLECISQESWMLPGDVPYSEKALRLEHYNEIWGYQMIRSVDTSGGVYRSDHEASVSNLNSREYIQTLWVTNESQITDAFLAGADGTTLNYTVAVAVAGNAKSNGAVFAAIEDKYVREYLQAQPMHTILLGKKQQCMSGNDESSIGGTLEAMLSSKKLVGDSLEDTLLKVKNNESGTFWVFEGLMPVCYSFKNVGLGSEWTVLTTVSFGDVVHELMPVIVVNILGIIISITAFILFNKTGLPQQRL